MNMYVVWFEVQVDNEDLLATAKGIIKCYLDQVHVEWEGHFPCLRGFGFTCHSGDLYEVRNEMITNMMVELETASIQSRFRVSQFDHPLPAQSSKGFKDES